MHMLRKEKSKTKNVVLCYFHFSKFYLSNSIDALVPQSFIKDTLTDRVFYGLEWNAI